MYTEEDVRDFPLWFHLKTKKYYFVVAVAVCGTNGDRNGEESVIYRSMEEVDFTKKRLYYRDKAEFLDGRFVPCTADGMMISRYLPNHPIQHTNPLE